MGVTRRELVWSMAAMVGMPGRLARLIEGAAQPGANRSGWLPGADLANLTSLCDAILPASPSMGGALQAGAPGFIDALLLESEAGAQHAFLAGLSAVVEHSRHDHRDSDPPDSEPARA